MERGRSRVRANKAVVFRVCGGLWAGFFFWRWDIVRIGMRGGRKGGVRVWEDSDIRGEGRGELGKCM